MLATIELLLRFLTKGGSSVSTRFLASGMHLSLYGAALVGPKRLSSATYRTASRYIIFENAILLVRGLDRAESLTGALSIAAASFALYQGR